MKTDWEGVYRATYAEVRRFLARMLWDDDRAEDLAQEAFVRAIGTDASNPRGFVFRIAANLARDEARMVVRRRKHLTLLETDADVAGKKVSTPAQELEARERAATLRRALAELSETDREVLLLWNAGLDYEEIAAQTGLSKGSLGTTIARAKKKLVSAHDALGRSDAALR